MSDHDGNQSTQNRGATTPGGHAEHNIRGNVSVSNKLIASRRSSQTSNYFLNQGARAMGIGQQLNPRVKPELSVSNATVAEMITPMNKNININGSLNDVGADSQGTVNTQNANIKANIKLNNILTNMTPGSIAHNVDIQSFRNSQGGLEGIKKMTTTPAYDNEIRDETASSY